MKNIRKEELLCQFPAVPSDILETMQGRGANNFAVMLTRGQELFVRCFHRYFEGKIEERQRYVFAKDGSVRYGSDDGKKWTARKDFREPVFYKLCYGRTRDNNYRILNRQAVSESCMKYSGLEYYHGSLVMEYLHLYCKHKNLEYLMKSGYECVLIEYDYGFWGGQKHLSVMEKINWKSNHLLKMLGLNRSEFKALQKHEYEYPLFLVWKEMFPDCSPEELVAMASTFHYRQNEMHRLCELTNLKAPRLALYLSEHNVNLHDYSDYLGQCIRLEYNLHDTAISMPHDFMQMHTRLTEIIQYQENAVHEQLLKEHLPERRKLEFQSGNLLILQPNSMGEIIAEGKNLHHCVGGYAKRHAEYTLHILFIRQKSSPNKSFYTMEVSQNGKIIQVRGDRNIAPTPEVKELTETYQDYLKNIFKEEISA